MSTGQTKKTSHPGGGGGGGGKDSSTAQNKRKIHPGGGGKDNGGGSSSLSKHKKSKSSPSSTSTTTNNANSSTSTNNNKRQLKHERQSTRKHAEIVQEAKTIWNQLRLKTNTPQDIQKLMQQIMPLITNKATEIALQHDASRCVQAAIQFGNKQQRLAIVTELTSTPGNLVELSKSRYAQFVVLKMIQYCGTDDECMIKIIRNLKGHLVKMATHAVASKIIEALFFGKQQQQQVTSVSSKKQLAILKQEFYGPQFSLFASSNDFNVNHETSSTTTTTTTTAKKIPDLESNLATLTTLEKKTATLEFVANLLHTCMEKSLYGYEYFQTLLCEYCIEASPMELRNLASTSAHNAIHLLATRSGTRALSYLIAYATAKDRKAMLKSIKGYARSGLLHKDAYLAIIRLVQLTDDTVVVQKNLLQEIITTPTKDNKDNVIISKDKDKKQQTHEQQDNEQNQQDSPLLQICTSETGSKLFFYLLPNPVQETTAGGDAAASTSSSSSSSWRKYFDPYELSVLFENPTIPTSSSSNSNSGNVEQGEPTSKKNPILKRQELLDNCLREPLIQVCCQHTEQLLRSRSGCAVLKEVYHAFSSDSRRPELVRAIVDVCVASMDEAEKKNANSDNDNDDKGSQPLLLPLLEDRIGHLAIKNLLLLDANVDDLKSHIALFGTESRESLVATHFLDSLSDRLMDIAQNNRGAFVVAALCKVPYVRKTTIANLDQKRLEVLSKQENVPTAGFEALLKEIKSL